MKLKTMFPVVANLTGKSVKEIRNLPFSDLSKTLEVASKIMAESPENPVELPIKIDISEGELIFSKHATAATMAHIPVGGDKAGEEELDETAEKFECDEWPYTMLLTYPVQLGSETKSEIVFRNRLTSGMVENMDVEGGMVLADLFPAIARMTGETTVTVERMRWYDVQQAMKVVGYFLAGGQPTGVKK
jgi:hypothetical protein